MSQPNPSMRVIRAIFEHMRLMYAGISSRPDIAYDKMVAYYIVIAIIWFWPYLFADQVISLGHIWSNSLVKVNADESQLQQFLQRNKPLNPLLSDIIHHTIPETSYLLHGFRESGVISHWNNLTGLGRQSVNFSANGAMNYVVWFMNLFTDDAYRMISFRNISLIFLGGLFMMFLLRELRIQPISTLVAGVITLTLPLYAYWSSFLEFYVSMTCSLIIMYGLYRARHTKSTATWVLIALTSYFMFITGYMQQNLFLAYFLAGVFTIILWRHHTLSQERITYALFVVSSIVMAGVLALPVLIDIYIISQSTMRTLNFGNQPPAYFPSAYDVAQFFLPVSYDRIPWSDYTISPLMMFQLLRGRHITLFMGILIVVGLMRNWHKTKGLFAFLCVSFAFSYIPFVHAIGARVFFPTVSEWIKFFDFAPLFIVLLIIIAHGIDAIFLQPVRFSRADLAIPAFALLMIILIVVQAYEQSLPVRWWYLGFEVLGVFVILLALWSQTTLQLKAVGIVGMACVIGTIVSFPQMYRQPYSETLPTPSMMTKMQRYVEPDSYMAQYFWRFHPRGNQNVYYGVPSIHMFHNLVSTYYLKFMSDIGGVNESVENKTFATFEGDYHSLSFWLANVSVIIAPRDVIINDLELLDKDGRTNIYRIENRGFGLQIDTHTHAQHVQYFYTDGLLHATIDDPRTYSYKVPTKYTATSDQYEVNSLYNTPSLMVFSQIFDSRWQADVLINNQWQRAENVVVNDIFQGARIPAEATRVRMTFLPWSRYMIYGHVIWSILLLLVAYNAIQQFFVWVRRSSPVTRVSPSPFHE